MRRSLVPVTTSGMAGRDPLAISVMDSFHQTDKGIYHERLIALMIERSGMVPLSSGTDPVRAYQVLRDRVTRALHGRCSVSANRRLGTHVYDSPMAGHVAPACPLARAMNVRTG